MRNPVKQIVTQVRNSMGDCGFEDWKPADDKQQFAERQLTEQQFTEQQSNLASAETTENNEQASDNVVIENILHLHENAITTKTITYDSSELILDCIKQLTDDQLLHANIGDFPESVGFRRIS